MSDIERMRPHRVGELIQQELANLLTHEVKDPRIGFATVTEVRLTGDLKLAKVYVSIYGTAEGRAESLEGLAKAAGFLKREISRRLKLRFIPELQFVHDDSLDRADRMMQLIKAIERGETEAPPADAQQIVPVSTQRSELADKRRDFEAEEKKRAKGPRRRTTRRRR